MTTNFKNKKYIKSFIDLNSEVDYCVLVKGSWGSGKTWFIKQIIEEDKDKFLYLSLYGVNSVDDINALIFQALHPFLASPGMRVLGGVIKSLARFGVNVNFDGDSKPDGNVSPDLSKLDITEFLRRVKNKVIVFDDLERANMDACSVLGFINNFVEHDKLKVILLSNEDELLRIKSGDEVNRYGITKEKVIGKTIEIFPEVDDAVDCFISKIDNPAKDVLFQHRDLIIDVYKNSNCNNLRVLKHAIFDFGKIGFLFLDNVIRNLDLMKAIICRYFVYAIEIRLGVVDKEKIKNIDGFLVNQFFFSEDDDTLGDLKELIKRYESLPNMAVLAPSGEFIFNFVDKGWVDEELFEKSISSTEFYTKDESSLRKIAYRLYSLSDDEFEFNLNEIKQKYTKREYKDLDSVCWCFSIFLWLSESGLIRKTKKEILNEFKKYVRFMMNVDEGCNYLIDFFGVNSFGSDYPEFKEGMAFVEDVRGVIEKRTVKEKSKELLYLILTDVDKFIRIMLPNNEVSYWNTAILHYIPESEFFHAYLKLNQSDRRKIGLFFRERYKSLFSDNLLDELDWLEKINKIFVSASKKNKTKISCFLMGRISETAIKPSIENLRARKGMKEIGN